MRWWHWGLIVAAAAAGFAGGYLLGFAQAPDLIPGQWCTGDMLLADCFREWQPLVAGLLALLGGATAAAVALATLQQIKKEVSLTAHRFGFDAIHRFRRELTRINCALGQLLVALDAIHEELKHGIEGPMDEVLSRLKNSVQYYRARTYLPQPVRRELEAVLWRLERRKIPGVVPVSADELQRLRDAVNTTGKRHVREEAREQAAMLGLDPDRIMPEEDDHAITSASTDEAS